MRIIGNKTMQKLHNSIPTDKKFTIEVSISELAVILRLREFQFGELTIFKTDGIPVRIVVGSSIMLSDEEVKNYLKSLKKQ